MFEKVGHNPGRGAGAEVAPLVERRSIKKISAERRDRAGHGRGDRPLREPAKEAGAARDDPTRKKLARDDRGRRDSEQDAEKEQTAHARRVSEGRPQIAQEKPDRLAVEEVTREPEGSPAPRERKERQAGGGDSDSAAGPPQRAGRGTTNARVRSRKEDDEDDDQREDRELGAREHHARSRGQSPFTENSSRRERA